MNTNPKTFTFTFWIIIFIQNFSPAQSSRMVIEGDMNIKGALDIYYRPDTTSIFIGNLAGIPGTFGQANKNTLLGFDAGYWNAPGSKSTIYGDLNTLLGYQAGNFVGYTNNNTLIGSATGRDIGLGIDNTMAGYQAGEDAEGSGSVFIGFQAGKGSIKTSNTLFIHNQSGDAPLIFGDFTNRKVGINYNGAQPDLLLVEAPSDQNAFRVRIAGLTKFRVHKNGGISVGVNRRPKDENGLLIEHLAGDYGGRVHVDSLGVLQRSNGLLWNNVHGCDFRGNGWNGLGYNMDHLKVSFAQAGAVEVFAPIILKNNMRIREFQLRFIDNFFDGRATIKLRKHFYDGTLEEIVLLDTEDTPNSFTTIQNITIPVNILVDSQEYHMDLFIEKESTGDGGNKGFELYVVRIGYEY